MDWVDTENICMCYNNILIIVPVVCIVDTVLLWMPHSVMNRKSTESVFFYLLVHTTKSKNLIPEIVSLPLRIPQEKCNFGRFSVR